MDFGLENADKVIVSDTLFNLNIGVWFDIAILLIFAFLALWIIKIFLQRYFKKIKHDKHVVFLVRLPKEKPGDKDKEFTVQMMREEIAKGETIFASIGGLRAERGWQSWLTGRNDHFSFEIVANEKKIYFYVVAPSNSGRYIEQQVNAHYPDAVIEEMPDYNIFRKTGVAAGGYLKTVKSLILPLKTYLKQDSDMMNSVINIMSKLEPEEGMAVQFVVRSALPGWHRRINEVTRKIHQGNTLKEALGTSRWPGVFKIFSELFSSSKPPMQNPGYDQPRRLTAMEDDILKEIQSKNAKAGLDVNLRVVVGALNMNKAQQYIQNLSSAFSQYNYYEYGNSFKGKISLRQSDRVISDFIFRRFDPDISFLLNTEELASLYHLPLKTAETPNIVWLTAKHAPAPANIPTEGILLGYNYYRGVARNIQIKRDDRRRHMYIVGKSGVGKSQFMAGMAIQDIINGEGVCVLDPHGDLIDNILERIPPARAEDVVLFAPADLERPIALNLLEFDENFPEQKTFVINEMIKIFDKLYDLNQTGGPIFEQYIRNAMLLIMSDPSSGSTLMEVPKVLADPEFRKLKLERCHDQTVVDFWRKEAEKAGGEAALANVVPYVTSKLTQFISNDTMRPIIGQQKSSFNLRQIMDDKKILLIDLSKGAIGEMNAFLLGMILVGKLLMSALSRTNIPLERRSDFYLYIDEFQNFTTDSVSTILSEARKYGLNLIIANQYLGQLVKNQDTTIRDAVFGNVGTWVNFKIGPEDAEIMEKEFSPVFNQYDLINIEKYTVYIKLLIDNSAARPFSMKTLWPLPGISNPQVAEKIRKLSRIKYGQDRRLIEEAIKKRTQLY